MLKQLGVFDILTYTELIMPYKLSFYSLRKPNFKYLLCSQALKAAFCGLPSPSSTTSFAKATACIKRKSPSPAA